MQFTVYKSPSQYGFTLVELMITLAVAAILISVAVPSFTSMISDNRLTTQANDFVMAMNLARSEAIKRNTTVNVTATGGNWNSGWTVATGATTIRTFDALSGSSALSSAGSFASFQYQASGRINVADALTLCDSARTGETGRTINIALTGHVSTSTVGCP